MYGTVLGRDVFQGPLDWGCEGTPLGRDIFPGPLDWVCEGTSLGLWGEVSFRDL